ncbi:MAG: hypothetical protein R3Y51_00210 [Rikenellaceae bacterium]
MKQIVTFTLLISFILGCASQHNLQINEKDLTTNIESDSIIIRGRVIEEKSRQKTKNITPIEGVIFAFLDLRYKDELIKDPLFYQKDSTVHIPASNYAVSDKNGYFNLKLEKNKYVTKSIYIGYDNAIIDIIPVEQEIDLGEIELKATIIDDSDDFMKVRNSRKSMK